MCVGVVAVYWLSRELSRVCGCVSLVDEGVCDEKNVPSISSINRIIRDHSTLTSRRLRTTTADISHDDVSTSSLSLQ